MNKLELYLIQWTVYIFSIIFMLFDLHYSPEDNNVFQELFYLLTNGILILRVLGNFWTTIVIHACIPLFVLYAIGSVANEGKHVSHVPMTFYVVPLMTQIAFTVILFIQAMISRARDRKLYLGIHAQVGILVTIILFWMISQIDKRSPWCGLSALAYMLTFFIIILTPQFQGVSRSVVKLELKEDEPLETLTTINTECGPVGPGHRRYEDDDVEL